MCPRKCQDSPDRAMHYPVMTSVKPRYPQLLPLVSESYIFITGEIKVSWYRFQQVCTITTQERKQSCGDFYPSTMSIIWGCFLMNLQSSNDGNVLIVLG